MKHRFYYYVYPLGVFHLSKPEHLAMHATIDELEARIVADGYEQYMDRDRRGRYLECDDENLASIFKLAYT